MVKEILQELRNGGVTQPGNGDNGKLEDAPVSLMDYKEMKQFIDDVYQFKVKRDLYSRSQGNNILELQLLMQHYF